MTNDQINTAIAQKLGWTDIEQHPSGHWIGRKRVGGLLELIPDFCNSLDACRVAEDTLDARETKEYVDTICWETDDGSGDPDITWIILLTPKERALALCKTWVLKP